MERRMAQPSHFARRDESARMVAAVRAAMRRLAAERVVERAAPTTSDADPPAELKRDRNARRSTRPTSSQGAPTTDTG
jgi:hypothetical protein